VLGDPSLVARTIGWLHRGGPLQSEPGKLVGGPDRVKLEDSGTAHGTTAGRLDGLMAGRTCQHASTSHSLSEKTVAVKPVSLSRRQAVGPC
jgi:hypothetical protein